MSDEVKRKDDETLLAWGRAREEVIDKLESFVRAKERIMIWEAVCAYEKAAREREKFMVRVYGDINE